MQIIALRTLKRFWADDPQAETPLRAWYAAVKAAEWTKPADVKAQFGATVDFIADNRLIFDIAGNKYRSSSMSPTDSGACWSSSSAATTPMTR